MQLRLLTLSGKGFSFQPEALLQHAVQIWGLDNACSFSVDQEVQRYVRMLCYACVAACLVGASEARLSRCE